MNRKGIEAGRAYVKAYWDNTLVGRGLRVMEVNGRRSFRKLQTYAAAAGKKMKVVGDVAKGVGRQLLSIGTAAGVPLAVASKVFMEFDDKMRQVRAVTNASEDDFARLTDRAKELGRTTSFSASQVAEAMQFLGMAGFNTEQILAGVPATLDLARAGMLDLGMASDIVSDVGSAFGLAADEIGHIGDVMATVASSANTNIEMMGESFKYAAPIAKLAGQNLEDTATAIGILGNNGIKASEAGTGLAMTLQKLVDPTVQKTLKGIGVDVLDAGGKVRRVIDIMRDLSAATAGMGEGERAGFLAATFDARALRSVATLMKDASSFDKLRQKVDAATGSASRMAKTMDAGIGGAWRAFVSAAEGAAIAIGDQLAPVLNDLAKWVTTATLRITEWVSKNGELVRGLLKWGGILVGVGGALTGLGATINLVASAMIGLKAGSMALLTMWPAMKLAIASLIAMKIGQWAYNGSSAIQELNRAVAAYLKTSQQMDSIQDKRRKGVLDIADRTTDAGLKEKYLRSQLAVAQKEAQGARASAKGARKQADTAATDDAENSWLGGLAGNKIVDELARDADLAERNAERAEAFVEELKSRMGGGSAGGAIPMGNVAGLDPGDSSESLGAGAEAAADRVAELERELALLNGTLTETDAELADLQAEGLVDESEIERIRQLRAEIDKLKASKEAEEKLADQAEDQKELGQQITEQFRTPAEVLRDEAAKLQSLLGSGAIDETTFGRAMQDAQERYLEDSEEDRDPLRPEDAVNSATELNTTEGQAAIAAAMRGGLDGTDRVEGAIDRQTDELVAAVEGLRATGPGRNDAVTSDLQDVLPTGVAKRIAGGPQMLPQLAGLLPTLGGLRNGPAFNPAAMQALAGGPRGETGTDVVKAISETNQLLKGVQNENAETRREIAELRRGGTVLKTGGRI